MPPNLYSPSRPAYVRKRQVDEAGTLLHTTPPKTQEKGWWWAFRPLPSPSPTLMVACRRGGDLSKKRKKKFSSISFLPFFSSGMPHVPSASRPSSSRNSRSRNGHWFSCRCGLSISFTIMVGGISENSGHQHGWGEENGEMEVGKGRLKGWWIGLDLAGEWKRRGGPAKCRFRSMDNAPTMTFWFRPD